MVAYDFYQEKFFGDTIPEESFPKFEARALDELHLITHGRLKGRRSYNDDEKKAVCAIAEKLYLLDVETKHAGVDAEGRGKVISSESVGNESVSYSVQKSDISAAVTSEQERGKLIYTAAKRYLSETGLLYAGY